VPFPKPRNLPKLLHKWFVYQSFLSPRKLKENSRSTLFLNWAFYRPSQYGEASGRVEITH
jgi:hypothetical protein